MAPLGIEYLTSNQHIAYPFKEDVLGLARQGDAPTHGAAATIPLDFLADAVFYLPADKYTAKVFLTSINPSGGGWALHFATETGAVIANITYDGTMLPLRVIGSQSAQSVTVRLLKGASFDTHLATIAGVTDVYGLRLELEACVVEVQPARIDSLLVCDSNGVIKSGQPVNGIRDAAQILPGYNMDHAVRPSTITDTTDIVLSAVPGAGLGVAPASSQAPLDRPKAPMSLIPDRFGGIRIEGDACYEIVPYGTTAFQIQGACANCCTCADYVAAATALKQLIANVHAARAQLRDVVHKHYTEALAKYNDEYFPAVRRPFINIKAIRGVAPGSVAQVSISVRLVNKACGDITEVELTLITTPTAKILSGSYTMGQQTVSAASLPVEIPKVLAGDGVSYTYLMTTGSAQFPVLTVEAHLTYVLDGKGYTITAYSGPVEAG